MSPAQKRRKKQQLIQRDGNNCYWCEKQLPESELTIDHFIPQSKMKNSPGKNSMQNLRLACLACNRQRGDKPYPPGHMLKWDDLILFATLFQQLNIKKL